MEDNRVCYTYYVHHLPTGKKYYGSRYGKNCRPEDLWINYFTSSSMVKQLIKDYGKETFFVEVRKVFGNDKVAAQLWEKKVLKKLDVLHKEEWLNKNVGGHCTLSKEQYKEIGIKISNTKKSKNYVAWNKGLKGYYSDEMLKQLSENATKRFTGKKKSKQSVEKSAAKLRGIPKSEEHKEKIRKATIEYNKNHPENIPYCKKQKQERIANYDLNPVKCVACDKYLTYDQNRTGIKSCSRSCSHKVKIYKCEHV